MPPHMVSGRAGRRYPRTGAVVRLPRCAQGEVGVAEGLVKGMVAGETMMVEVGRAVSPQSRTP